MAEGSLHLFSPIPSQCHDSRAFKDCRAQKPEMCPVLQGANEDLLLLSCLLVNAEAQHVLFLRCCYALFMCPFSLLQKVNDLKLSHN